MNVESKGLFGHSHGRTSSPTIQPRFDGDGILAMIEKSLDRKKQENIGESMELRNFETGAMRSKDADDTRYDLISPIALEEVAKTCSEGASKYGDFNWEHGMPVHDLLNHAIRHLYKYLSGDRSQPHLGHAAWNVLGAIHSEKLWPDLNEAHLRQPGCKPPAVNCKETV